MAQAGRLNLPVEPIAFVTRDVPSDIAAVARGRNVDLVLMGFHKPVFGATVLGGKVHRVLEQSRVDVAILVDRGFATTQKILVPFLGNAHDRAAMTLAGALRRAAERPSRFYTWWRRNGRPMRRCSRQSSWSEKTFSDPTQRGTCHFSVIEDASPVDAVLREANQFDLVVIGVAEQWGLESHLFGFRPERIVEECTRSILIVRHFDA